MKELRFAVKRTIPIFFTYVFIGIAFGVMMAEAGYSVGWSVLSSVVIYAGSMQVAMVSLLTAGAPLWTVAVMTFFINARHIFYGVGFIEKFRKRGWLYPYMVFSLTDETYSIFCNIKYEEGLDEKKADFLIAALNQSYWILGTFLGGCAGRFLPWDLTGIEFSATAFFLVVAIEQWRECESRLPAITGLVCAVGFYLILGPGSFLIPALAVSMGVLMIMKDRAGILKNGEGKA